MSLEAPITFGAGVSIRLAADLGAYIASPGFADPRLVVRRRERPMFPLLQFDRCVFRFQFPPQTVQGGRRSKKLLSDQRTTNTHLTYGRTVCLVHAYSGLYVTVVRKPADANAAHFSAVLMSQEDAGSACRFRVMPRYKIRTEGDCVYDRDMIYLQQESSQLSLHAVSSVSTGPEEAECTAAEIATSLEINLYDEAEQPELERHPILRAGCASLIFHREKDALLTLLSDERFAQEQAASTISPTSTGARTAFPNKQIDTAAAPSAARTTTTANNAPVAKGCICFHHYDKPVTNLSPEQLEYGCNALWFFENVDPTVGGTIEPHAPFRVRHGATGGYLSKSATPASNSRISGMNGDFCFVELNTTEALESTIFELELVSSGGGPASKIFSSKSFVRIRHRNSCSFLSSRKLTNSSISTLIAEENPNLEDTVTVLMVPRKRQQELCYLIGNVEFLSSYIKMFYTMQDPHCQLRPQDPLVARVVQRAAASLSALTCFCTESEDDDPLTREGLPIPTHQQSMFEVQLHRIVMDVLLCPFVGAAKENKMELPLEGGVMSISNLLDEKLEHIHRVCRLCYRLLKQMSKGSPHAWQLVEYVAFMQAQEGYKLHVADTQLEIFTNNSNIPQERCETNVRHFVNLLLTKERSAGYLRFLSSLCVVNGSGVPYNQVLVASLLLKENYDRIFYPMKLTADGELMLLVPPAPPKKKKGADLLAIQALSQPKAATEPAWVALAEFLKTGEPKMIKFFESSIELLSNLCIGSEPSCLEIVRSLVSMDHITAAIDPAFACSDFLRSSYFTLSLHLYTREILSSCGSTRPLAVNTCGALVRSHPVSQPTGTVTTTKGSTTVTNTPRSPKNVGAPFDADGRPQSTEAFLNNIKQKALIYIEQLREKEVGTAGSDLVLVLSHIWHSIVVHETYTHDELVEAVHAVIMCLDTTNVAKNPDRYKRSEDTENAMRMKQGLCSFLRTVLGHEVTRITDLVLVELSKGMVQAASPVGSTSAPSPKSDAGGAGHEDQGGAAAAKQASTLLDELQVTFMQDSLLPILTDLMFYENKELVSAAVELTQLLCNAPGIVAVRVRDAELVAPQSSRSFDMFYKADRDLKQNLSVTGKIINEEALIMSVRELTLFDPTEEADQKNMSMVRRSSSTYSRDDEVMEREDAEQEEEQLQRTAASAARLHRSMSRVFKRGATAVMTMNRLANAVVDKRGRWRRTASNLEEYARLLYRSHVHETLLRLLQLNEGVSPQLLQVLMEFFRILCVANDSASALGSQMSAFIPFLHKPATQLDAAAIVLRVVEVNPWLADKLDEPTVMQLTSIMLQTKDPSIAEGLEHATLGEYPFARNQNIVAAALVDAKMVDRFVSDALTESNATHMAFRSACVDLVSCCCVNNASCRSLIAHAVSAEGVIQVLELSSMPPAHLVPYYKLLTSGFLSSEDDLTAQELHQKRRQWADHPRWWKLIEGRIFALLTIDEDTSIDPDTIFLGVVPMLNAFYAHLFGPVPCSKSKVAIPLSRVVRRVSHFADAFLRNKEFAKHANENRIGSLQQLIATMTTHMDAKHDLYQQMVELHDTLHAHLARLRAEASEKKTHTAIAGVEVFAKWSCNTKEALEPLLHLWSGDQHGALYKCQAQSLRLKQLHELLVQHIADGALSEDGAMCVMAVFRLSISQFEDDPPQFIEAQNYINSIGALKMITETAFSSSETTGSEAFQLAIAVLEGGNKSVQDLLLNFFTSTDERFFHETSSSISYATRRALQKRSREAYLSFYALTNSRALSFGNLQANLRFLQLMCEGHHLGLQDYLREQQDNLRSVNVVKDIVLLLSELVLHEASNFSLMLQTLNVLTEFCQGPCVGNQKQIVSVGGCQSIHAVLTAPLFAVEAPFDTEEAAQMLQLKRSAVTLLLALLEGNTDDTIAAVIMYEIPMQGLSALTNQLIETPEFAQQTNEDICEVVYSLMISVHTLVNIAADKDKPDVHATMEEAKRLLETNSSKCGMLGKIELERHDRIERAYFRVPTICSLLSEETRQKLLWSLDRSTQGSKLSDFLDKVDEVIFDLEATHRVTQRMTTDNPFFKFCARWPLRKWDDASLCVAIVMNLLFVVVMEDAQGLLDRSTDWLGVEGVLRLCAYTQLMISVVIAYLDGSLNFPLILYKQAKKHALVQVHPTRLKKAAAIIRRSETIYRSANVVFALMGFFFSDFFFAFHLLGLITKSSVLKNVIVAVTQNGKSLLLTGILGCILVYLFSIIAFVMFQDHFESDACLSLNNCVLHILTSGLRQGGGIGDGMKEVKYGEPMYLRRTLFDFLFWAIMIVIFLNILFGIIIDTFAELRDDKSKKEEDMRTKCLICGIDSYTFDRYGSGFHEHVKTEHNMWQYLYFLHHLRRKEPTEYTGQESYVAGCVAKGDISFFPAGKCSSLKNVPMVSGDDDGHREDPVDERHALGDGVGQLAAIGPGGRQGGGGHHAHQGDHRSIVHNGSMVGGGAAYLSSAASVDHLLHGGNASMIAASSDQAASALARIMQRLDTMEKGMYLGSVASGTNFSGRLQRLESGISGRSETASPLLSKDAARAQQQHLMEVDHNYQLHLTHLKHEQEGRYRRLFDAMSEAFEKFSAHFQFIQALSEAYMRSKVELFASNMRTRTVLLCAKIGELTRFGELMNTEIGNLNQHHQKTREANRLHQMMRAMELTTPASPREGSTTTASTSPPSSTGQETATHSNDMTTLMQQGHEYMLLLRQMTSEHRAAHVSKGFTDDAYRGR